MYANVSFVCAKLQYGVHLRPALTPMHLNKATWVCDWDKVTREMLLTSPATEADSSISQQIYQKPLGAGRSCEVNNPTAKLLPAVCFALGLFLRGDGKLLFSIILEYGVPRHFFLPVLF